MKQSMNEERRWEEYSSIQEWMHGWRGDDVDVVDVDVDVDDDDDDDVDSAVVAADATDVVDEIL